MLDNLIDDCLILIFEKLPLLERIRLESVCRRWLYLMPYSDFRSFSLSQISSLHRHQRSHRYLRHSQWRQVQIVDSGYLYRVFLELLSRVFCRLTRVDLAGTAFNLCVTANMMEKLVDLSPRLREVVAKQAHIEAKALEKMCQLKFLTKLNLAGCVFMTERGTHFSDEIRLKIYLDSLLHNLHHLTHLNLKRCPIRPLIRNPNLKFLNISHTHLQDIDLEDICKSCVFLESLNLESCKALTDFSSIGLLVHLRSLVAVDTGMHDHHVSLIVKDCVGLEKLYLLNCANITDTSAFKMMQNVTHLMFSCQKFRDVDLARIARRGKLQAISASESRLTDEGIRYLAKHCPQLRQLTICNTMVGDWGLLHILDHCAELECLNVQGTLVTDQFLQCIGSLASENLNCVYVLNCPNINLSGLGPLYEERLIRLESGENLSWLNLYIWDADYQLHRQMMTERMKSAKIHLHIIRPMLALESGVN